VTLRCLVALCLAVAVAVGAPSGSAKPFPLKVSAPARATLKTFVNRTFRETVTCQTACKVKTSVVIKANVAKRLGFKHVRGKLVVIATNQGTLKARTPTKLSFVLTGEAKRHLPAAKSGVGIFGSVRSTPSNRSSANYSVGWASQLT
jgi:hypothetical protein